MQLVKHNYPIRQERDFSSMQLKAALVNKGQDIYKFSVDEIAYLESQGPLFGS